MGWKMVYNFLGIDEKTQRNLPTFDQNVRIVYSNIRTVYPSKNHVTTHLEFRNRAMRFDETLIKLFDTDIGFKKIFCLTA